MSSSGKYPGNGASLEDCHTNIFALADLNGLKWKAFVYYHRASTIKPQKVEGDDAWNARTDPLLTSYVKCLSAGVLAVWRLKPNSGDAPTSAYDAGAGARARSFDGYWRDGRELWVFWHGDDPDFVDLLCPELTNFESGTWDNGIAYECRTLLFKSFHNVIERYLIMHGFIRLGKWFLEPHVYDKNLENRKHLAFSFSFFLHGESAICTSLDIKQLPAIFRLDNKLLGISQNSTEPLKVILSPFALSGTLTGKSFKENDPGIRDLILGWDLHYPYSYHKLKSGETGENSAGREPSTNIPKVLEVCAGGFTMSYPACHIFVAEGDNKLAENDKAPRYSITGQAPTPPATNSVSKDGSELSGPIGLFPARPFWAVGHSSSYGQLSPPESPLANNHSAAPTTPSDATNHFNHQDSLCHSLKNAPNDALSFERSWTESRGVDHTLASAATQQNFCKKCLDCELRAMDKMPKNDDSDYRWEFQNPGSFRLCECQKSTSNQCQSERSFGAPLPSTSFSTRHRKHRPNTTSRPDTRVRARPYNVFGPAGDGQAAFHKRRRPSVTYSNHSNFRPDENPKSRLTRPDPFVRPTDKNTGIDGQINVISRPEPVLTKPDPQAPLKSSRSSQYESTGAARFKETLLKETLLDIVHKRQQSQGRPVGHLENNSNLGRAQGAPLTFENFYVPLCRIPMRSTGQLMSNVPPISFNSRMLQTSSNLATNLGRDDATGEESKLTMTDNDSLRQENNHNLAQLMAKPPSQQLRENTSRSLEERMFDPYEFNDDFNHPNPNKTGPANSGQGPNPPRYGSQKVTGTGSVGDITAPAYGNVKAEVKEEQASSSVYEQNIFHTLNQYSSSLLSQRTATTMDIDKDNPPVNAMHTNQEVEDVKKWDGTQQTLAASKAMSLSLNFNNPALGSVSLNTLLGAPPINPGILTSSDLSRIFPTPPSLENNNLYSPCGNIAVPPPLGTVPALDASSYGISVSGTGVCQSISVALPYSIDSSSPTSGQVINPSNSTTAQTESSSNLPYNEHSETFQASQQANVSTYGFPTSTTNIDLLPSLELLKKSLEPAVSSSVAASNRLEWYRKKVRARSAPTSALQLKLNRLNAVVDQFYVESNSSNQEEMESFDANGASTKSFQPLTLQPEPAIDPISTGTALFKYVPASGSTTNRQISASKLNDHNRISDSLSDYPWARNKGGPGFKPDNTKDSSAGGRAGSSTSSSSLLVNLILSSSTAPGINYFADTNFDACPLCVCNMTIRDDVTRDRLAQLATWPLEDWVDPSLVRNFPALAALFKEHSPKMGSGVGYNQQHSHNCMCGFNGAINRIKAFGAGLFYEDEMEITNTPGPKSLLSLFNLTPPPINQTKLYNNAKTPQMEPTSATNKLLSEGNRGASSYPQARRDYLLELAHSQGALCPIVEPLSCLINQPTACDRPEAITRARPYYYNARLYLDQCKIGLAALGIGSAILNDFGHLGTDIRRQQQQGTALLAPAPKLGWRSALNLLFTMHLWPHYQNSENLSSEDTLVTLRSLRPLIQDAILKKGGVRSCLFEHAYNISGPLTWQQFHKLTGRGNEERCEPQPLPLILTGYEHERLSLSPLAINFWEYLHVEPYSLPKDIAYVAIIPDDESLIALASTFFENLNATYEVCKLGRHLPLSRVRDGMLKVGVNIAKSFPDNTLNNWNHSFGKSCWEKKLKLYALAIKNQLGPLLTTAPLSLNIPLTSCSTTLTHSSSNHCENLGSEINATGPKLPQQQQQGGYLAQNGYNTAGGQFHQNHPQPGEEPTFKYGQPYIGEPESGQHQNSDSYTSSSTQTLDQTNNATAACNYNSATIVGAGDKSTSDSLSIVLYLLDPFSIFPPQHSNCQDTSATTSFAKYFTLGLTKAYTDMVMELPEDVRRKITLKILPLQTLIQAGNSRFESGDSRQTTHVSNHYRTFALSLYSQIRYVVPCDKPSQSYTGFGPGVHKNSILQKNQASGYNHSGSPTFYAPPYVLAPQQNRLPDYGQMLGRKPKISHPAHHSYGPKSNNGSSNNSGRITREGSAVLFCGYCLSHDQKWLLATATDDRGQILDACFINMDTPNRFRKKKGALQRAVLKKLWDFVVKIVSGTNTMWRITIGRFGRIGHGELKVWSSLLSKRNLQRCNAELRDCCRACSIVPLGGQLATEQSGGKVAAPGVAILSACLISLDLNANFQVMANSVAPELDRMGYSKLCPLTTPKDVSCTHILVFPLSATAQPSGTESREEDVAMEDLVGGGRGRNDAPLNHFSLGGGAPKRHDDLLDDVIAPHRDPLATEGGAARGGGGAAGGDEDDDDDDLLLLNAFSDLPIDQFLIDVDDVMMMEEDGGGGGGGAEESNTSSSFASTGLHHVGAPHHHHHGNQHPHAMSTTNHHAKPTQQRALGLVGPHHHHLAHDQSNPPSGHVTTYQNGALVHTSPILERRKRHSGLEYSDEPIMLLQQPLALGYYVSTAKIGPLPYWFYSANHFIASENRPSFLNAALHINCASVIHSNDDLFSHTSFKNEHKNHPLDSDQTTDILRYVLEGYNRLSWLVMDPSTRDRVSCLPLHLQILLNIYHMLATYS